jgi:hypothetical protein
VNDDRTKQRRLLEAQVERWTTDAKKLRDAGKEGVALDLYRRAADAMAGAPWLQHRTAELARKLRQHDAAIIYFRRAAAAFQGADFPKRAVAPLRTAWSLAVEGLPGTCKALVDIAVELMQLHRKLGFAADASVTFERTNAALRGRGFSEIPAHVLDSMRPEPVSSPPPSSLRAGATSLPPSSAPAPPTAPPASDVAPRASQTPEERPSMRSRALARLLGRR